MSLLEDSREERKETTYEEIFGDLGPRIYLLSNDIFDRMNAKCVDPCWLTHGVFKSPPSETRNTWTYVTSGMSNPWETEEPEAFSGLGVEFVMETDEEADWAIEVLQTLMAYNLLLVSGRVGDFRLLILGTVFPLHFLLA